MAAPKALHDVLAPAKLNLFLHITGRRPDGYHLLQSAFMLVDWCDTLHLERRSDGQISREDLGEPLPADDLVLRAARALQQATASPWGAHIAIDKRIPAQAGMGGGSSDAASVLLALNRLWDTRLSRSQLQRLALGLGADVPFFVGGHNAWVEGIGEQLTPLTLPAAHFAVLKPAAGLSTAAIFADPALERQTKPAILADFAADPFGFGRNDLQPVAQRLCPQIDQALTLLGQAGLTGRMTGSGSAVFAPCSGVVSQLQVPDQWRWRVCSNLEAHPLRDWATSDK